VLHWEFEFRIDRRLSLNNLELLKTNAVGIGMTISSIGVSSIAKAIS